MDPIKMPEEWLKFITKESRSYDGPSRYKFCMQLYRRAIKAIPVDEYGHNNNAYAKILIDFAKLHAKTSEYEARNVFQTARNNVKHCSLVYVAWAQFELLHNNPSKCKKLLNKGKQSCAEPAGLLDRALENLASGNTQLVDEETEEYTFTELINRGSSTSEDDTAGRLSGKHTARRSDSDHGYSPTGLSSPDNSQPEPPRAVGRDSENMDGRKRSEEIESKPAGAVVNLTAVESQDAKTSPNVQGPHRNSLHENRASCESDSATFSLPVIRRKHVGYSESSEEVDSLSSLFNRNKVPVGNQQNQATFVTPQTVKATPQSVSTYKYPTGGSSVTNNKTRSQKRLGFIGLPRRVAIPKKEETEDLEEDEIDPAEEEKKPDIETPRNKEGDSVDGVFPFAESEKRTLPSVSENILPSSSSSSSKRIHENRSSTCTEATPQQHPTPSLPDGQPRQPCSVSAAATSYEKVRAEPSGTSSHKHEYKTHDTSSRPVDSARHILHATPFYDAGDRPPNGAIAAQPMSAPFTSNNVLVVNGKVYHKLITIGRGGSSKVYSAFDGEKTWAIKYVSVEDADHAVIQSYVNEITLLKRLQGHESIVKLYDWEMDEVGKVIKLVLEIGSIDLAGYLRKNPEKITRDFIKVCWKQILDAVQVVHDNGIVHSDLKPANFLLVEGNLKLIDFGIANAIQADMTSFMRDSQIGTLNYMSPEALKDVKIGRASDVWALGCILYLMVYGKTPFQHISNHMQKWQSIMDPTYEIKYPRIENQDLVDTMKGCLKRNPKERYTISQLQNHPFLTGKTKANDVETVLNCLRQMKEINSPTTLRTLTRNMLQELSCGRSLDMASIQPLHISSQPCRQPLCQNISSSVPQQKKNYQYFAGGHEGDKENAGTKASR